MTDKTATQNLTRTTITDSPRQMATYLGSLAREVDQRMQAQRDALARSQKPPAAMIEVLEQREELAAINAGSMFFDNVAFDTAGLVDLTVDNHVITLNSTGYWCIGAYVLCSGFQGSPGAVSLWLNHGNSNSTATFHDGLQGAVGCSYSVTEQVTSIATPKYAACGVYGTGTNVNPSTVIFRASLWAFKIRDL